MKGFLVKIFSSNLKKSFLLSLPLTCCNQPRAKKPSCEVIPAKIDQFVMILSPLSYVAILSKPDNEVVSLQTLDSRLEDVSLQGLLVLEKVDLIKPNLDDSGHSIIVHQPRYCFSVFSFTRVRFLYGVPGSKNTAQ